MGSIVETAIETLYEAHIPLGPGLTTDEIADVEQQFGIKFSPDHAGLLSLATPLGPKWVDWLGEPDGIRQRLSWPLEGVLFDVEQNAFWPDEWGERPSETATALQAAREHKQSVPTLIPIYSHRFEIRRVQLYITSVIGVPKWAGGGLKEALLLPSDQGSINRRRDGLRVCVDAVDDVEAVGNPGDVLERDVDER